MTEIAPEIETVEPESPRASLVRIILPILPFDHTGTDGRRQTAEAVAESMQVILDGVMIATRTDAYSQALRVIGSQKRGRKPEDPVYTVLSNVENALYALGAQRREEPEVVEVGIPAEWKADPPTLERTDG